MRRMQHSVTVSCVLISALAAAAGFAREASAASQLAPVNTDPPTITGTPRVGETLTTQVGTWENNPTAFQYQWRRCARDGTACVNVSGAVQKTYRLVEADTGRTMRVRVTAVNADGATTVRSAATGVVTSNAAAPRNSARPVVTGEARVGQELAASEGTWTGTPTSFAFQWHRCDVEAATCSDVGGATGKTYGVRLADLGFRLRVQVTARNDSGTAAATSGVTTVVVPTVAITNRRPTLGILSIRFLGARVYARFRICDDSPRNLAIIQTDSRPGRAPFTRRFATRFPPRPCGAYTRSWVPAPRFRSGRYTITLRARDTSRLTSAPARRTFKR